MKWTKEMLDEFCRLKYVEGMSLNQIAEAMGITKAAARNKNSRILKERRESQGEKQNGAPENSGNPVKKEEPDVWGDAMQWVAIKKWGRLEGEILGIIGAMWEEILKKSGSRGVKTSGETVTKMLGALQVVLSTLEKGRNAEMNAGTGTGKLDSAIGIFRGN